MVCPNGVSQIVGVLWVLFCAHLMAASALQADDRAAPANSCEQGRQLATTIFKRTATGGHGFVLMWGWVGNAVSFARFSSTLHNITHRFGNEARAVCFTGRTGRSAFLCCSNSRKVSLLFTMRMYAADTGSCCARVHNPWLRR